MSFSKTYQNLLKTHFLLVQSVQTACLMGLGDVLAQKVVEKKTWKDYRVKRTADFIFLGSCLVIVGMGLPRDGTTSYIKPTKVDKMMITSNKTVSFYSKGPAITAWYKFLQKQFGSDKSAQTTLRKVAADQLLFAPGFLIVFITSVGILHRKDFEHIKKDIQTKYWDIVTTNWKVWPAFQLVNFYFLPLKYQVLFVQALAIVWNTYLTWKTGKDD